MMFMLVDTRRPPDEGGGQAGEPWLVSMLDWVLPWPALIVWLCAASRMIDGWPGVACVFAAVWLAAWRGLRSLPADGLNEQRQ